MQEKSTTLRKSTCVINLEICNFYSISQTIDSAVIIHHQTMYSSTFISDKGSLSSNNVKFQDSNKGKCEKCQRTENVVFDPVKWANICLMIRYQFWKYQNIKKDWMIWWLFYYLLILNNMLMRPLLRTNI